MVNRLQQAFMVKASETYLTKGFPLDCEEQNNFNFLQYIQDNVRVEYSKLLPETVLVHITITRNALLAIVSENVEYVEGYKCLKQSRSLNLLDLIEATISTKFLKVPLPTKSSEITYGNYLTHISRHSKTKMFSSPRDTYRTIGYLTEDILQVLLDNEPEVLSFYKQQKE